MPAAAKVLDVCSEFVEAALPRLARGPRNVRRHDQVRDVAGQQWIAVFRRLDLEHVDRCAAEPPGPQRVGQRRGVAHAAAAFGMQVAIANRPGGDRVPGRVDLADLLQRADVLSLHCPLTPATTGMIGARELASMKPDALLVNTARGALVDAQALADALRAGRLGGAAIDVLEVEPPVHGNPLLAGDIPNLIVTPHVAWAAREARQRCFDELAANVEDFRRGGHRGRVV